MKREPIIFPACRSDACKQGKAACPTPQACRVPDRIVIADDNGGEWSGATWGEIAALAAPVLIACFGALALWAMFY